MSHNPSEIIIICWYQWLIDILFTGNGSSPSCMINPSTRCVRTKGLAAPDGCWASVAFIWLTVGGWAGGLSSTGWNFGGKQLSTGDISNGWVMEDWMGDMSEDRLEIARKMKTVVILPTGSINAASGFRRLYGVLSNILRYELSQILKHSDKLYIFDEKHLTFHCRLWLYIPEWLSDWVDISSHWSSFSAGHGATEVESVSFFCDVFIWLSVLESSVQTVILSKTWNAEIVHVNIYSLKHYCKTVLR